MFIYTQDAETMLKNANVVKEVVLGALEREGLLTKKAEEIAPLYAIVMHKRGWLGQFWDKWFEGVEKDSFRVTFVKIV
jgi:hypothetical protein